MLSARRCHNLVERQKQVARNSDPTHQPATSILMNVSLTSKQRHTVQIEESGEKLIPRSFLSQQQLEPLLQSHDDDDVAPGLVLATKSQSLRTRLTSAQSGCL